jgi:hypothetical protein
LAPETRTASPWIDPATLSFASLSSLTMLLPFSTGMPTLTLTGCFTLSPEIFSAVPSSSVRTSTLRFARRLRSTSMTWFSLKSSSAKTFSSNAFCSMRASEPLKS